MYCNVIAEAVQSASLLVRFADQWKTVAGSLQCVQWASATHIVDHKYLCSCTLDVSIRKVCTGMLQLGCVCLVCVEDVVGHIHALLSLSSRDLTQLRHMGGFRPGLLLHWCWLLSHSAHVWFCTLVLHLICFWFMLAPRKWLHSAARHHDAHTLLNGADTFLGSVQGHCHWL